MKTNLQQYFDLRKLIVRFVGNNFIMAYGNEIEMLFFFGKTFTNIEKVEDEELIFTLSDGSQYKMYHEQDCCEGVYIESVIGDLSDLIGSPITMAEEATNNKEFPEDVEKSEYLGSFTWTFYKFATVKGYVTIRWLGQSNGYYSESVQIVKI